MKNTIAKAIRIAAVVIFILGTIGSIYLSAGPSFSFGTFLQNLMTIVLAGLLLLGFSEIIELLDEQADSSLLLVKKIDLVIHSEKTEAGKRPPAASEPKRCAKCDCVLPPKSNTCPHCHHYNG